MSKPDDLMPVIYGNFYKFEKSEKKVTKFEFYCIETAPFKVISMHPD